MWYIGLNGEWADWYHISTPVIFVGKFLGTAKSKPHMVCLETHETVNTHVIVQNWTEPVVSGIHESETAVLSSRQRIMI